MTTSNVTIVLKNITGSDISLPGLATNSIPALDQVTISSTEPLLSNIYENDNLRTLIASGDIVVNDGIGDLGASEGEFLIKPFQQSPRTNIIAIGDESDYPHQDATTITLKAGYNYLQTKAHTITKKIFVEGNAAWTGNEAPAILTVTYTGTDPMFTSTGASLLLGNIVVTCPNATLLDIDGASNFLTTRFICLDCDDFIVANNVGSINMQDTTCVDSATNCLTLSGTMNTLSITRFRGIISTGTGVCVDLGTAVISNIEMANLVLSGPVGGIGISGAASSANVVAGNIASVSMSDLAQGDNLTPLSGIATTDIRWNFNTTSGSSTNPIQNSRYAADAYLLTTETVTIVTPGVFVDVGGVNWQSDIAEKLSVSTAGVITNISEQIIDVRISGFVTVAKVGGGADTLSAKLRHSVDGILQKSGGSTENNNPTSIPIDVLSVLKPAESLTLSVANLVGTSNVEVDVAGLTTVGG